MSEKSPGFKVLALAVLAALAIAVVYFQFFMPRDVEISRKMFPDKTQEVAYLPDSSAEQRLKVILFDTDGFTKIRGTIYWKNGIIEDITFRKDNTLATSLEHYARDDKEGWNVRAEKRSEATFAKDGESYLTHRVLRKDGTLERSGEQLSSTYLTKYYYPDGTTVQRERTFDQRHRFRTEKLYRPDGTLLASIYSEKGDPTDTSTSLYRPDGTMSAIFTRHPTNGEEGQVFAANGSTVLAEYHRDYFNVQEIYRDEEGHLIQVREGSRMGGLLTVRHYRQGDFVMDFRQRYLMPYTMGPEAEKVKLRRIEYYDFAAKRACEISMYPDGLRVATITCPEANGGQTIKQIDEDGKTVKAIQHKAKSGKVRVETPKNQVISIDPRWLENTRPLALPNFVDVDAPPMVYDYH